jgi:Aromatic-ring hydroxylase, C-terminal
MVLCNRGMPRTARAAVGGMWYHVLNHCNCREAVFHKPGDYDAFVEAIIERPRAAFRGCARILSDAESFSPVDASPSRRRLGPMGAVVAHGPRPTLAPPLRYQRARPVALRRRAASSVWPGWRMFCGNARRNWVLRSGWALLSSILNRRNHLGLSALLVRPDGFVAWASDGEPDPQAAAAAMQHWFGDGNQ